jgi:hypothetical protein
MIFLLPYPAYKYDITLHNNRVRAGEFYLNLRMQEAKGG